MYQKKNNLSNKSTKKSNVGSKKKPVHHSPTLKTIRMVEDTLKNMEYGHIKISGLKRILPKQVNHNTLMEILDYLEKNNKILVTLSGVGYVYTPPAKLKKILSTTTRINPEDIRKYLDKLNKEHPL